MCRRAERWTRRCRSFKADRLAVADLPAVAALRRTDPGAYERFSDRYLRAAQGANDDRLLTVMRTALRKSVKRQLANAPGDTLIDITRASLAYLLRLQAANPESCVSMADDGMGASLTADLANEFPVQFVRELDLLERIAGIPSDTKIPPPAEDEVRPHLATVIQTVGQMNVQTRLQALDTLDPSQFAPYCTLVIAFYAAVLDLPHDDAVKVLRHLYAGAAETADRDSNR
jgi:hypothetical protein